MDFSLSPEQQQLQGSIEKLCADFDDDYWLELDTNGGFPTAFFDALAGAGWLGICIPEAHGGSGLGITEAISAASSAVRVIGASARRSTMARAMRRLMRSSP